MPYSKGEIYWVDLGNPPDQVVGHEQGKRRPCIILSDVAHLKLAQIVPTTSQGAIKTQPTVIFVSSGTGGLRSDSYILVHQIRTVSHDRIDKKIGDMPQNVMDEIDVVLADMFDL